MTRLTRLRNIGCGVIVASTLAFPADARSARAEAPDHPRARLFQTGAADDTVVDALRSGARWTVLFLPRIEDCTSQEIQIVRALKRVARDFSDVSIVTIVPEGLSPRFLERGVFGEPFPGKVLRVRAQSWIKETRLAPRPRIEIWSGRGELLLMRSVPAAASESAIYEEVLWARAFTTQPSAPGADR